MSERLWSGSLRMSAACHIVPLTDLVDEAVVDAVVGWSRDHVSSLASPSKAVATYVA